MKFGSTLFSVVLYVNKLQAVEIIFLMEEYRVRPLLSAILNPRKLACIPDSFRNFRNPISGNFVISEDYTEHQKARGRRRRRKESRRRRGGGVEGTLTL